MPMRAQNQAYPFPGFPPEFSPLVTSRPEPEQGPLVPSTKFVKSSNPIPGHYNHYIVVLDDEVVSSNAPLETRRARITEIANSNALAHGGTVGFVYGTALKGYSIELPNEAAAIAISKDPQVKWVEQDERGQSAQSQPEFAETNPPWGLDAISRGIPTATPDANGRTNGLFVWDKSGLGVTAYVLDSGINRQHVEFFNGFNSRASQAADCFTYVNCQSGTHTPYWNSQACAYPMPNANNNDCFGHGTYVAGTLGGSTYGVAKDVTIKSIKAGSTYGYYDSAMIAGVDWVTSDHQANPSVPAVANISVEFPTGLGVEGAVVNSIRSGVTYVVSAGNNNDDARNYSPSNVVDALTVGAVDYTGTRPSFSNWGLGVDLFAPGVNVVSAQSGNGVCLLWDGSNTSACISSGTSAAAPHVAGAVAMYLEGRTGVANSCALYPIQGPAPSGGNLSTCPDRVARFIKANTFLSRLTNINGSDPLSPSPNRFLATTALMPDMPSNPIYNHRFFVWQHYPDFLTRVEPDEAGLDWWTKEITGNPIDGHGCNVGVNTNNTCTNDWRINSSRSFWLAIHQDWFTGNYGLVPYTSTDPVYNTANKRFLRWAYKFYLQREPNGPPDNNFDGFNFWLTDLTNNYGGDPANQDGVRHIIDMFINSSEYRRRFGQA